MDIPIGDPRLFNSVAELYSRVRPGYPDELFDEVFQYAQLPAGGRILEVGCGPGTASVPLARRGYTLECVELGPDMAAVARHNLRAFPNVQVQVANFESWETESRFDLIVSASAFHWIAAKRRYQKVFELLTPGGALAIWWNRHVRVPSDAGFFDAVQSVYRDVAPHMLKPMHSPDSLPQPEREELGSCGLFHDIETRTWLWTRSYAAAEYTQLLSTHSDHLALSTTQRDRLFAGISRLIEEQFGGQITKGYLTVLHMGRKQV